MTAGSAILRKSGISCSNACTFPHLDICEKGVSCNKKRTRAPTMLLTRKKKCSLLLMKECKTIYTVQYQAEVLYWEYLRWSPIELDRYVGHFLHDTKQRTIISDYCPSLLLGFPGFHNTLSQAWSHTRIYTSPHRAYFCIQPFLAQHSEMTMECTMPASNINPIESKFGSQLSMIFSKTMRIPSAYAWAMLPCCLSTVYTRIR